MQIVFACIKICIYCIFSTSIKLGSTSVVKSENANAQYIIEKSLAYANLPTTSINIWPTVLLCNNTDINLCIGYDKNQDYIFELKKNTYTSEICIKVFSFIHYDRLWDQDLRSVIKKFLKLFFLKKKLHVVLKVAFLGIVVFCF